MKQLSDGARSMGIPLTRDQLNTFEMYYETLIEWNSRMNLTRITDYEQVQVKHFLDSLSCLLAFPRDAIAPAGINAVGLCVIDVGSGAGFPGVVLKIALPALRATLVEATGKKAEFLRFLVDKLALSDVQVISARAEEVGQDPAHREHYDVALARALADMAVLAELTLPLVRVGGRVIAQKGDNPRTEMETARNAIITLGGQIRELMSVAVPGLEAGRHLAVLDKVAPTPARYPRRPGMPAKRPLI